MLIVVLVDSTTGIVKKGKVFVKQDIELAKEYEKYLRARNCGAEFVFVGVCE